MRGVGIGRLLLSFVVSFLLPIFCNIQKYHIRQCLFDLLIMMQKSYLNETNYVLHGRKVNDKYEATYNER